MKKIFFLILIFNSFLLFSAISNQKANPEYFSPNSDNIKDTTSLEFDVDEVLNCSMAVYRSTGSKEMVRKIFNFGLRTPSGNPNPEIWDGKDDSGNILEDSTYFFKVSGSNLNFTYTQTFGNSGNSDANKRIYFYYNYGVAASSNIIVSASYSNGIVQRLDPNSNDALWRRTGIYQAFGVCVDTNYVWVTRYNYHRIVKLDVNNGTIVGGFYNASWGNYLRGIEKVKIGGKDYLLFCDDGNDRVWAVDPDTCGLTNIFGGNSYFSSGTNPRDVDVDSSGYIYVCRSDRITRFNSDGTNPVDIITGLDNAFGMEIEGDYIYVAEAGRAWGRFDDNYGHFISKYDLSGNPVNIDDDNILGNLPGGPNNVWTFNSSPYDKDKFWYPVGVAVNEEGNIFVADTNNYRVVEFSSSGNFLNEWASYSYYPRGIAVNNNGDVVVARTWHTIQVYSSTGTLKYHLQGYGAWNSSQDSGWYYGNDVNVDSYGNLYIACRYYKIGVGWKYGILKLTSDGNYVASVEISHATEAGICVDENNNAVYLADGQAQSSTTGVWKTDLNLNNPELIISNLDRPRGIAVDSEGNLYVTETYDHQVYKFEKDSWKKLWQLGKAGDFYGTGNGEFYYPWGIDVIDDYVFVCDWQNARIQVFSKDGLMLGKFGSYGTGNTQFNRPMYIEATKENNEYYIYVSDYYNARIQKIKVDLSNVSFAQNNVKIDTAKPSSPQGLSVLNEGSGSKLNLSWSASTDSISGVEGYNIYRANNSGGPYSIIVSTLNALEYQDTGLTEGVTYYYVLEAVDFAGNKSLFSSEVSAYPEDTPPSAPQNLYASGAGTGKINLSWEANPETDVQGYYVYRSSGSGFIKVSSLISGTTHQDTGVLENVTYYYKITAYDGNNEGPFSSTVSATTYDDTPPSSISDLSSIRLNEEGKIKLSWTAPGDDGTTGVASQYDIRYGTYSITEENFSNFQVLSPVPTPSPSGTKEEVITSLSPGVTYYFAIKTADENNNWSGISNVIFIQTPAKPEISLLTFNDGKTYGDGPNGTGNAINEIKWQYSDLNKDNTHYFHIYVSSDGGSSWREIEDENGGIVGDLPDGTTFYFWDTRQFPNNTTSKIKIVVFDSDGLSNSVISDQFSIKNLNVAPVVNLISPNGGETWSGERIIKWEIEDKNRTDSHSFSLFISSDSGLTFMSLTEGTTVYISSATWNTKKYLDGLNYRIKVKATDDNSEGFLSGEDYSDGDFSIDNGNSPPSPFSLISPEDGKHLNVSKPILSWEASDDPNGDTVTYSVFISSYNNQNFKEIASSLTETQFTFSNDLVDGVSYWWRVEASDGFLETSSEERFFKIDLTAPSLISATLKDENENGKIEKVTLVFSEEMDDYSFSPSSFTLDGIKGSSIDTGSNQNDAEVSIIFDNEIDGTGLKELIINENACKDIAGNPLSEIANISEIDGARPVILEAKTQDKNSNGIVDRIKITFSEKINDSTVNYADFSLEGNSGINFETGSSNDEVIFIDFTETDLGPESKPTLSYSAGNLSDLNSVFMKSTTTVCKDGIPPSVPELTQEPEFTKGTSNEISWSDESSSGANRYFVECSTDSNFSTIFSSSGWISETNYNFSGLQEKKYFYRVKARDSSGNESDFSESVFSTQDNTPPYPVTTLVATSLTAGDIGLEWQKSVDSISDVSYYKIFRSSDNNNFVQISTTNLTHFVDYFENGLIDGVTFYYYVVPVDNVGNKQNSGNNVSSAICKNVGPRAPQFVSEPEFTKGTTNEVSWNEVKGAVEYFVEMSENEDFTNSQNSGWITETSYQFSGLQDGKKYFYRVKAKDSVGNESSWSFSVFSTQDDSGPSPISDLSAEIGNKQGEIIIKFTTPDDSISGLDSYIVKYATFMISLINWDSITEFQQNWSPEYPSEERVISGLLPNTSYWIAVKSKDKVGNVSEISNIATSHTFTPPSVDVVFPSQGSTLSKIEEIKWNYSDLNSSDTIRFKILISSNDFASYEIIASTNMVSNTTFYSFDTRKYFNGEYKIKIIAYDPAGLSDEAISEVFTIGNVNEKPIVQVLYPNGGEIVGGYVEIKWNAFDNNIYDNLTFRVEVSDDGGINWNTLIEGTTSYEYLWNTTKGEDGSNYFIRITAKDDGFTTGGNSSLENSDTSDSFFSVSNINQAPYDFYLLSPDKIANSLTPILRWENNGDPNPGDILSYKIYISTDPDFKNLLIEDTSDKNLYKVELSSRLEDRTTYFWKVVAYDSKEVPAIKYGKGILEGSTYYYSRFFVVDEPPYISTTTPKNGDKKFVNEISEVKVYFNKRMSTTSFENNILVLDENENSISFSKIYDDDNFTLKLDFDIEPSHIYTIIFNKEITDLIGRKMERDFSFSFTTLLPENQDNIVESKDKILKVEISSGTLPSGSYVLINPLTESSSAKVYEANMKVKSLNNYRPIYSKSYEVNAYDQNGNKISYISKEIKLTFRYNDNSPEDGYVDGTRTKVDYLKIFRLDENNNKWNLVRGSNVDKTKKEVWVNINHFSIFSVFAYAPPKEILSNVINFPNPFNPFEEETTIAYILTEDCNVTIRIFNLFGDLVKKMFFEKGSEGGKGSSGGYDNRVSWDGRNDYGMIVANGVYICEIYAENENGSYKKIRKIAVLK